MELLQATTSAMDLNFNLGDLIVLGGVLIPAIIGYQKLKGKCDNNGDAIASISEKQKDDILHIQNGKRSMKKELIQLLKEESERTHKRIDKTQERQEKLHSDTQQELKGMNEKLNKILGLLEK